MVAALGGGARNAATRGSVQTRAPATVAALQLFRPRLPAEEELARLAEMREGHPEYAAQILRQGEQLVALAAAGCLDELVQISLACREGELLAWSCARAFKAACTNGRVAVIKFMSENGIDRRHPGLRHLIHELIEEHAATDPVLVQVLPLLVQQCGFDVNGMRRGDGLTPLHIACAASRLPIFKLLVLLGADVHAIANDNSLPLSLAQSAAARASTAADAVAAGEICAFLRKLGAQDQVKHLSYAG